MSTITAPDPPYHLKLSKQNTPIPTLSHQAISDFLNTKCTNSLKNLKQAHALAIKNGSAHDNYIAGSLVKCYSNPQFNTFFSCALKVFDKMPQPHAFLWNSIIKGCLNNNDPQEALFMYYKMVVAQAWPNEFTFPTLFKACAVVGAVEKGEQLHAHVMKLGLVGDGHVRSSAIRMYAKCGRVKEARQVLDESREADVVCWNAMIDGYLKCGDVEAATALFEAKEEKNVGSWNAMISGYARCGKIELAEKLFREMPQRDEISWSAIIDGYIKQGCFKEALIVFHEMQNSGARLRKSVLSSVLAACANVGALDEGKWIHAYISRNSIQLDAILGTSLLDMYAKCGRLDMAWEVFENMKQKRVFSWNAMIGGLAMHGRAKDAIELFLKMQRDENLKPDGITFVGVLSACAHAGLVEQGLQYFNSMKQKYGVEPAVEHYGCIVNLLGRAGLFAEAQELIKSMPMTPNAAVWGALLGACRTHGNVELGGKLGKLLLELEPQNSGRYALLSHIYANAGRWDDVANVRTLMKDRNIKTASGRSVINLNGVTHEFVMGDGSHPHMKQINVMLEEVIEKLRLVGYVPNTTQVLFDIDEEEKETRLCRHSEKIAIAFGLLNTSPGTTIQIVKNLRVCEDCHDATKLISRMYDREIIVRDRVRYHHFRNGSCSCKDFW